MPHLRIVHLKTEDIGTIPQAQQPTQIQTVQDIRTTRLGKRYNKKFANKNKNIPKPLAKNTTRTFKQENPTTVIHLIPANSPSHTQIIKQEEDIQTQSTYQHTYLLPSEVKQEEFSPPHTHLIKSAEPPTPIHTLRLL